MSQSSPKSHKRAAPATSLQADTTAKRVAAHQESHSYALPSELTVAAKEEYEFEDALPSPQTETCVEGSSPAVERGHATNPLHLLNSGSYTVTKLLLHPKSLAFLCGDASLLVNTTPHLGPKLPLAVIKLMEAQQVRKVPLIAVHVGRTNALGLDLHLYIILPALAAMYHDNGIKDGLCGSYSTGCAAHACRTWWNAAMLPALSSSNLTEQSDTTWRGLPVSIVHTADKAASRRRGSMNWCSERSIPAAELAAIWTNVQGRYATHEKLSDAYLIAYGVPPKNCPAARSTAFTAAWARSINVHQLCINGKSKVSTDISL